MPTLQASLDKKQMILIPAVEPTWGGHPYQKPLKRTHQPSKPKLNSHLSSEMADGRRPDGSYGPEYGPQPPDHDYALYRHMPSRGRDPWPLNHGDYPGRLLERRLRRETFGFSRDPLQPLAPFHIHHVHGRGGVTMNSRRRQENPGLTDDEFREAMDQLSKQKYRPSNPCYKKRGDGRAVTQNRGVARAEAPLPAPEEKTCTICLETFVPGEEVVVTPCNHMFHPGCLTPWVKGHGNCPVCRSAMCERRNVVTATGNYGDVDLDLLEMMRTMEEAFSRVRLSDFMLHR